MLKNVVLLPIVGLWCVGCSANSGVVEAPPVVGVVGVVGYWDQGWEQVTAPEGANMAIAFMGYSDITEALRDSAGLKSRMVGKKYLAVGGGNKAGEFSATTLVAVTTALKAGQVTGYDGIAFDVEMCVGTGLAEHFSNAFSAAENEGLEVLVTVSHSEPFGCDDSTTLMKSFLSDESIDYLSPQLYTTGKETQHDYTADGTPWSAYAGAKAAVVPSLARASLYADAQRYFSSQGVTLGGFIEWSHSAEGK